ncbi:MAG: hypothetical protein ACYTDT_09950 [Planctomycetota bacterium]
MTHQNRKATKAEMAHARRVIKEAFPKWNHLIERYGLVEFGSGSAVGLCGICWRRG